jgi:hypothetical protein
MSKVFSTVALAAAAMFLFATVASAKPGAATPPVKTKTPIALKANGAVKAKAGSLKTSTTAKVATSSSNAKSGYTKLAGKHPVVAAKMKTHVTANAKLRHHHRKHRRHQAWKNKVGSNASATGKANMSASGKLHSSQAGSKAHTK